MKNFHFIRIAAIAATATAIFLPFQAMAAEQSCNNSSTYPLAKPTCATPLISVPANYYIKVHAYSSGYNITEWGSGGVSRAGYVALKRVTPTAVVIVAQTNFTGRVSIKVRTSANALTRQYFVLVQATEMVGGLDVAGVVGQIFTGINVPNDPSSSPTCAPDHLCL